MRLIGLLIMSSLLFACNRKQRSPAQFQQTDEPLVNVGVPLQTIERELLKLAQGSPVIKRIDFVRMDPNTRILSVRGVLHFPLERLFNFGQTLPAGTPRDHSFEIAVSFPPMKEASQTRFFRLKFHRLTVNGDDYLPVFSVGASVIQTLMANSDLVHYVYEQTARSVRNPDAMTMMREIIDSNGFVVNETMKTIAVKLNLNYFSQLQPFQEIKDLRLWYFGPDLLSGTRNYMVFRLVAGIGKPSDYWVNQYNQDEARDRRSLDEVRRELYAQYGNHQEAQRQVQSYFQSLLRAENVQEAQLPPQYRREIESFLSAEGARLRGRLSTQNEVFLADPEAEYLGALDEGKARARAFYADLDRRLTIDALALQQSDPANTGRPLLTQRIGQDLLSGAMNYVRDIEADGQYWVKEAHAILAPHIPGVILRGKINIDLSYLLGLMNSGFIGKRFATNMREVTEGLPFEIVLETRMGTDGVLGLDAKSIRLLEGERQLRFDRTSQNQRFFLDLLKVYLAQSLAALNIDLTETTEPLDQQRARQLREQLAYLRSLQTQYTSLNPSDDLWRLLSLDLTHNPFATAGAEYLKKKGQILLSNLISYDDKDRLFKIRLDPRVVVDAVQGAQHNLQIWNVAPVTSSALNNTFLEVAVGEGRRGRSYVEGLRTRAQDLDHAGFTGLYNDHDRSAVDLLSSLSFRHLEATVNRMLQEMITAQNGDYQAELAIDKEQTHYILNNLTLEVRDRQRIFLKLKASVVEKKKTFLSWARTEKWRIDEDAYALSAEVGLHQRNLTQLRAQLRDDALPIYFSQEAIGLVPHRVAIEFGKPSLINLALGKLTNLNLDAPILSKVRALLLNIVSRYFNSFHKLKPGEERLLGHDIEAIAKVLTTREEIVLLLNPRLTGPAFELKLSGKDKFLDNALKIDAAAQELHVALTGAPGMAKIDKRELTEIWRATDQLFQAPLRQNNAAQLVKELNEALFVDRAVRASDVSKLSLYHRLLAVMRRYDAVLNSANIPNRATNADARLTSTGAELMYVAAASYNLYLRLDQLIKKLEASRTLTQVTFHQSLVEARRLLLENILRPMLLLYRARFQVLNAQIMKHPNAHWTVAFVPDAHFAEFAFQALLKKRILAP